MSMFIELIVTAGLITAVKIALAIEHHHASKHWPKEWR